MRIGSIGVNSPNWLRRWIVAMRLEAYRVGGRVSKVAELQRDFGFELRELDTKELLEEYTLRAEIIRAAGLTQAQQSRLMSTITNAGGGFLSPAPLLAEIFVDVEQHGDARRFFRPIVMRTPKELKQAKVILDFVGYWPGQGERITASDMQFGLETLQGKKLAALGVLTSELLEDFGEDRVDIFIESMARAVRKQEDLAGFIGDGSPTYGGCTGLLNQATTIHQLAAGKVSFDDVNFDDLKACRDKLPREFRQGAVWFIPPSIVSRFEEQKDLHGRYIFRTPSDGNPAMLWNFPIANNDGIEAMEEITDEPSAKCIAFGNPLWMHMGQGKDGFHFRLATLGVLDAEGAVTNNLFQGDQVAPVLTERVDFSLIAPSRISVLQLADA